MYIYLNGEVLPQEKAVISVFDHGFMYGLGVFETFRLYNGHPFLLDDHLERLNQSVSSLNIQQSFTRKYVNEVLQCLLEKNNLQDAYIRWNVSAGNGGIGLQTSPYLDANITAYIKKLPEGRKMAGKNGHILSIPRNTPEGSERIKSHHYLNNILAKREIGESPSVEGIFLTKEGYIAEGITSNIFWIKDKTLYTPSVETGILNGITRRFILMLAKHKGMEIKEGFYFVQELMDAEEVFVTNSIQEIVPITSIQSKDYLGIEGTFTKAFQLEYQQVSNWMWAMKEYEKWKK